MKKYQTRDFIGFKMRELNLCHDFRFLSREDGMVGFNILANDIITGKEQMEVFHIIYKTGPYIRNNDFAVEVNEDKVTFIIKNPLLAKIYRVEKDMEYPIERIKPVKATNFMDLVQDLYKESRNKTI